MASVEPTEYASVLDIIRQWPLDSRRELVRNVIKTIAVETPCPPAAAGFRPLKRRIAEDRSSRPDRRRMRADSRRGIDQEVWLMNVLIDVNVALDVLLEREPWLADSQAVWDASHEGRITGHLIATGLTNIFYVARRIVGRDKARAAARCVWRPSRSSSSIARPWSAPMPCRGTTWRTT